MNITVFGASRGVGRAAIDIASSRGHAVTAVARSFAVAPQTTIGAIAGDVLDRDVVRRALDGADAVVVALGTAPSRQPAGSQSEVCSRGTRFILDAMTGTRSPRIVVVSSYGIGPTRARRPFPFNIVAATLLKGVMADKERQEDEVRASATDWTIVQPLGLTDARATGTPFVATDGSRKSTRVSRADVATVCIDAVEQARYVRETIAISAAT